MNTLAIILILAVAAFCLLYDRVWEDAKPKGDNS